MTNEEAIERLNLMQERCCNGYDAEAINLTVKALEVVEKIKQAYSNCYKSYLNNLENDFNEETASFAFFQDVAFNINNILSDAYDTKEMMDWIKEIE